MVDCINHSIETFELVASGCHVRQTKSFLTGKSRHPMRLLRWHSMTPMTASLCCMHTRNKAILKRLKAKPSMIIILMRTAFSVADKACSSLQSCLLHRLSTPWRMELLSIFFLLPDTSDRMVCRKAPSTATSLTAPAVQKSIIMKLAALCAVTSELQIAAQKEVYQELPP